MGKTVSSPFELRVVARSPLPPWVPPPGTFAEFTLNTPGHVGVVKGTFANWCGGAFISDYGTMGGVAYHGGGEHNPWNDNQQGGVCVLNCGAQVYERRCVPSAPHVGALVSANGFLGSNTDEWGAYVDDGSPQSKHTYNCLAEMPTAWGGGPGGSLVRVAHTGGISKVLWAASGNPGSGGYAATWQFDLSKHAHSAGNPSISKLTGSHYYYYNTNKPTKIATTNDASTACNDYVRRGWWSAARTGAVGDSISFTSKTGQITNFAGPDLSIGWSAMHHFADDDILVRIGDHGSNRWLVYFWGISTGRNAKWVQIFPITPQDAKGFLAGYAHPRWSSILGAFVALNIRMPVGSPLTTVDVWKLTPPPAGQRVTGQWAWTKETLTSNDGSQINTRQDAGSVNGSFGKFVECPSLRSFVWTRNTNQKGQLMRLRGM